MTTNKEDKELHTHKKIGSLRNRADLKHQEPRKNLKKQIKQN